MPYLGWLLLASVAGGILAAGWPGLLFGLAMALVGSGVWRLVRRVLGRDGSARAVGGIVSGLVVGAPLVYWGCSIMTTDGSSDAGVYVGAYVLAAVTPVALVISAAFGAGLGQSK